MGDEGLSGLTGLSSITGGEQKGAVAETDSILLETGDIVLLEDSGEMLQEQN